MKDRIVRVVSMCAAVAVLAIGSAFGGVVFVSPEGSAEAGGTSWTDAKDLTSALAGAAENDELWLKAGTYDTNTTFVGTSVGAKISVPLTLKGGFTGAEGTSDARADDAWSVLDGCHVVTTVVSVAGVDGAKVAGAVTFDRLDIRHGFQRGVLSNGNGANLAFNRCRFVENGRKRKLDFSGSLHGRGCCLVGTASSTLAFSGCEISGQISDESYSGQYSLEHGVGAYVTTFKSVTMTDTLFTSNGFTKTGTSLNGRAGGSYGGALYLSGAPIAATGCRFIRNSAAQHSMKSGGVVYLGGASGGSSFQNCLFLGNWQNSFNTPGEPGPGMGTVQVDISDGGTIGFRNCTFAFNRAIGKQCAGGIGVSAGVANVTDSIFFGNMVPPRGNGWECSGDIRVSSASGSANIDHTLFAAKDENYVSGTAGTVTLVDGIVTGDPSFVTATEDVLAMCNQEVTLPFAPNNDKFLWTNDVLSVDVHIQSKGGRWLDGAWTKDAVNSIAIDAGAGAVRDEPSPNGGLVNLGFYGGTVEASKTQAAEATIDSVAVSQDTDWTRPHYFVTLGGEGVYHVGVYLCYGGEASAEAGTNGWAHVICGSTAAQLGDTVEIAPNAYFDTGDELQWRVVVLADGEIVSAKDDATTITSDPPPFRGHGGGASVVHVRKGGIAGSDGSDWEHAVPSFAAAVALLTETRSEIWVSGDVAMDCDETIKQAFAVRGGFTMLEDAAAERPATGRSVLDASGHDQLKVELADGLVMFDRVTITKAVKHGIYMTGGASLTLDDVGLVRNGTVGGVALTGRGLYFTGSKSKTALIVRKSDILGNRTPDGSSAYNSQKGIGFNLSGLKAVTLTDSLFASNGCNRGTSPCRDQGFTGGCILADAVNRIAAERCRFIGNGSSSRGNGKIIAIGGACDSGARYTFTNCLFAANYLYRWQESDKLGQAGVVGLGLTYSGSADFKNCTFAYNICDGEGACAGLMVGANCPTRVTDCIFWGNCSATNYTGVGRDIDQRGNVAVTVERTLLESTNAPCVYAAYPSKVTFTNMTLADPLYVSTADDFAAVTEIRCYNQDIKNSTVFMSDEALGSFNLHLRGGRGYTDETTGELIRVGGGDSPAIDAGSKGALLEPKPNGRRLNLGYYGGTPYATRSPDGLLLMVK